MGRTGATARRTADVAGRLREELRHLLGPQVRAHREEHGRRRAHLRRRERRPLTLPEVRDVLDGADRVALLRALLRAGGQGEREGGDDPLARRRDVVVDLVAVGEARDGAVPSESADAEHVRERSGIAGEGPGGRRLDAVADRRHDHDPLPVRVADRSSLERRVRVPVGVTRIAIAAEAHVDHARAVLDRPADRLDLGLDVDQLAGHDLRDEQLGGGSHPGDPDGVVDTRCDQAGDERAVALEIDAGGPADEALRVGDLVVRELRMRRVDA